MTVNMSKTKIIVFRKGGFPAANEVWRYGDEETEVVNSYKYLGLRIVHRVIATNVVLKKMGIINCEQCTFCDEKNPIKNVCGSATLPDASGDY